MMHYFYLLINILDYLMLMKKLNIFAKNDASKLKLYLKKIINLSRDAAFHMALTIS